MKLKDKNFDIQKYNKLSSTIFEIEFYKNKIDIEPDTKICPCFKKIYKFVLLIGEYILINKFYNQEISLDTLHKLLPESLPDVDVRAKMLAYIMLRPLIKDFLRKDFDYFCDNTESYIKSAKLILSGLHINCENLSCRKCVKDECAYFDKWCQHCESHKYVEENGEYIRFYIFPFIIFSKSYWIRYCFNMLDKLHKDLKSVKLILDYRNLPPELNYTWNEHSFARFSYAVERFGSVSIVHYEGRVNFGKYYNEIKDYLCGGQK